jgi:nitrate reductase NapD
MNIASLVLRIHPATWHEVEAALRALPGVECHCLSDDGRLVVTVEDVPGVAVSDTLTAIHYLPQVLAVTLAYEHTEPDILLSSPPGFPSQEVQPCH